MPGVRARDISITGQYMEVRDKDSNVVSINLPSHKGGDVYLDLLFTGEDANARTFARQALQLLHASAVATGAGRVTLMAVEAGGYVWPRLGFQLDEPWSDFISEDRGYRGFNRRIAAAEKVLPESKWQPAADLISVGGPDTPSRLARLDTPITALQMSRIIGASASGWVIDNGPTNVRTNSPTVGKALLYDSLGYYYLPASNFDKLYTWYRGRGR
jgi:hypothetical protein